MSELSTDLIIEAHNRIITNFGGTKGILCKGTLDFLVFDCTQKNNVFKKASCILRNIIQGHPFVDGNKRTAFETAKFVLKEEGYCIIEKNEVIIEFLRKIARTDVEDCEHVFIINWIKRKSKRLNKPTTII